MPIFCHQYCTISPENVNQRIEPCLGKKGGLKFLSMSLQQETCHFVGHLTPKEAMFLHDNKKV